MEKKKVVNKSVKLMKESPQRILIVFLSGIGNMILFLPTLQAIRDRYPDARIILWVKQMVVYEMIKNTGLVDEVHLYYQNKFCNLVRHFFVYLKLRKKKYDIIINTFIEWGYKIRFFTAALKGNLKLGYKANSLTDRFYSHLLDYSRKEHESDNHFKIAEFFDHNMIKKPPDLRLQDKEEKFARQFFLRNNIPEDRLIVGLHPGCSEFARNKRWHPEKFAKAADVISEKYDAEIIIFGGKEETALAKKVTDCMCSCLPLSLTGKATILETAAVIQKCNLFISNDSGLMHIATSLNIPTVAIFGPTNPTKNGPFGDKHIIVRKDLPCSPCLNYTSGKCRYLKCLKMITVEDVLNAVEKQLGIFMVAKR